MNEIYLKIARILAKQDFVNYDKVPDDTKQSYLRKAENLVVAVNRQGYIIADVDEYLRLKKLDVTDKMRKIQIQEGFN